jgi:cytochrome c-type biogenesis protein
MENISILAAFTAGVISFISPCVLPLIPGYLSFISGVSMEELKGGDKRSNVLRKVSLNTLFFVLGFSVVFVAMGASATFIGEFLLSNLSLFNKIAGVIIIILGLHIMGVFRISFLNYEKRFHAKGKPLGPFGSFLVGLAFAFGWTPCIGPILGGILALAANQDTVGKGMVLLSSYSLGLGIPFFITAVSFNTFLGFFGWVKKYFRTIEIIAGLLLVIIGFLMFVGSFGYIAGLLNQWLPWLQGGHGDSSGL